MTTEAARTDLVRIVTPVDPMLPSYRSNPHAGTIICLDHLKQIDCDSTIENLAVGVVSFFGLRCLMCGVEPSPGRHCGNEDCNKPLHAQWPAVYCCNRCALEDI